MYNRGAKEVIKKNGCLIMPEGMFKSLSKKRQEELKKLEYDNNKRKNKPIN